MLDLDAMRQLSAALQAEQKTHPRDNSFIRISSMGECSRKIGYRLLGTPECPTSSHALQAFDIGHGIHLRLQQRLSNCGLGWIDADPAIDARGEFGWRGNCELDVADDEYGLLGHLDGLTRPLVRREVAPGVSFLQPTVEEDPEGVRYVVDIKSISTRPYIFYQESGELEKIVPSAFEKLERAKIEHIQQISTYAWMTTRPGFKADRIAAPLSKIPEIMVVYVGKDLDPRFYEKYPKTYPLGSILNLPLKVFTFSVDPECVAVYLTKTNKIWDYHRRGELPPRDYHYTPTHPQSACEYCGYAPVCYRKEGWFQDAALESDLLLIDHALASPRQTS